MIGAPRIERGTFRKSLSSSRSFSLLLSQLSYAPYNRFVKLGLTKDITGRKGRRDVESGKRSRVTY